MDFMAIWRLQDLISGPAMRVMNSVNRAQRAVDNATASMGRGFSRATTSVNDLRSRIDSIRQYRDGLRIHVDTTEINVANRNLRTLQHQLDQVEARNGRRDGSGGGGGGPSGLMGMISRRLLPLVAATTLAQGASGFASAGMNRELTQSRYQQFAGNQKGLETFNQLNGFANDTIYKNSDVLRAGAKITEQFGADKALSQMKMYGNLAGGDAENLHGITRTMGQIKGVGSLQGDELNELANHGILGLQEKIASMKGVSVAMFYKMKEAGQISFNDVQKAMESFTAKGGKYFGYLDRMSATTFGRVQKLVGTLQDKFERLSMGSLPGLNAMLDWANKFIDNWQPILNAFSAFGKAFSPLFEAIKQVLEVLGIIPKSGDGVMEMVNGIAGVIAKLAGIVKFCGDVINNLVTGIRMLPFGDTIVQGLLLYGVFVKLRIATGLLAIQTALLATASSYTKFAEIGVLLSRIPWAAAFANTTYLKLLWIDLNTAFALTPIGLIIIGIIALAAALTYAWQNSKTFREVMIRSWYAIEPAVMRIWEIIKGFFMFFYDAGKGFYDFVIAPFVDGFVYIYNKVIEIWNKLDVKTKETFTKIGEFIKTSLRTAIAVATLGLSEAAIWTYNKVVPAAKAGYGGSAADAAVKAMEQQRSLDKDRSATQATRDARRAARTARIGSPMDVINKMTGHGSENPAGTGKEGKGAGISDTVTGAKSTNIIMNIKSLVETINNYVGAEATGKKVTGDIFEELNRALQSANRLAYE